MTSTIIPQGLLAPYQTKIFLFNPCEEVKPYSNKFLKDKGNFWKLGVLKYNRIPILLDTATNKVYSFKEDDLRFVASSKNKLNEIATKIAEFENQIVDLLSPKKGKSAQKNAQKIAKLLKILKVNLHKQDKEAFLEGNSFWTANIYRFYSDFALLFTYLENNPLDNDELYNFIIPLEPKENDNQLTNNDLSLYF